MNIVVKIVVAAAFVAAVALRIDAAIVGLSIAGIIAFPVDIR